jgi:low temperature requirement protein LtrA
MQQSWLHVTSFINRFASETFSDKLFIAWNLTSLGGVGINISRCMGADPHPATTDSPPSPTHDCRGVAGWLAFGRAGVCVWFALTMIHTRAQHSLRGFRFSRISLGTNLVSVVLMGAAAATALPKPTTGVALLVTAAVVDVIHIPALWFCTPFYRRSFVPVDADLAAERFGLIYLISLGELVLGSVEGNIRAGQPPHEGLRATGVMILGVLTGLFFQTAFFSLYDLRADHAKKHALEVSVLRVGGWVGGRSARCTN